MLGWINDCVEKLVTAKFGVEAWHTVKQKAGCDVKDGEFLKLDHYSDKSTIDLVAAASEVSGLTTDQIFEAFGAFFVSYVSDEGYENLLCCQGSTLKDWMNNINAIHSHLQTSFPKKMIMPEFWLDECKDGSIILHYQSKRGNYLAPIVKGTVTEAAKLLFEIDVVMDRVTTQGVDGSRFTSWRVSTRDPNEMYKLSTKKAGRDGLPKALTKLKCPMTGLTAVLPSKKSSSCPLSTDKHISLNSDFPVSMACPHMRQEVIRRNSNDTTSTHLTSSSSHTVSTKTSETGSLSAAVTKKLFPYHALVNSDFIILQVGKDLPRVLHSTEHELVGRHLDEVFEITKPIDAEWSWDWLRKLEDQSFSVEPAQLSADCSELNFKTSVVLVNDDPPEAMLIMCPDANNLEDLRDMGLTLSDFPIHGSHREVVFLREHLSTQMNNALNMEKLQVKSLAKEKALLESLLPVHAAENLRKGRTVEPILHNNVTMFFSDVVGFTNICDQLYPWEVISMLNRLYWVMDHLSLKFKLFKVETIGDAYVCCSGLPQADEQHAENVANFAIAVSHCCKQVLSPVDRRPIQLRIGIHTGPCASGVVGVTNPRYCVFGDTVNTTSRHESTGEPGKVHCSEETCKQLMRTTPENFKLVERGLVEMKGKGQLRTFWLTAKSANKAVNRAALTKLNEEVKKLLQETSFDSEMQSSNRSTGENLKQMESQFRHSMRKLEVTPHVNDTSISTESSRKLLSDDRLEVSKIQKSDTRVLSDRKQVKERGETNRSMFFI